MSCVGFSWVLAQVGCSLLNYLLQLRALGSWGGHAALAAGTVSGAASRLRPRDFVLQHHQTQSASVLLNVCPVMNDSACVFQAL